MRKTIINFVLISLIKGTLLFCIILIGNFVEAIPILLRFLVYFVTIGLVDWHMLNQIKDEIAEYRLIRAIGFSYLSFIATLWITGPLFQLYNFLTNTVVEREPQMPTSALIMYLIFGLFASSLSAITWTKKSKTIVAKMV